MTEGQIAEEVARLVAAMSQQPTPPFPHPPPSPLRKVAISSAAVCRVRFLRFAAAISPTASHSSTYLSTPIIVTLDRQWQVRIAIHGDAFYETTVTIPVAMH